MKSCIQCGAEAADDVPSCASCGRQFIYVTDSNGVVLNFTPPLPQKSVRPRPDGSVALAWCKGLGSAAIAFLIIALFGGRAALAPESAIDTLFYACLRMASGLFWIALVVGLAGYIVRAISFLPARGDIDAQD